ncbi:MAG TPA: peptidoglycan DD-metalloendopeptidase family protein [Saprospiraceae bacterium]|nr:peptidoglycan DD-metalloendopeptidase family protein [Saprospiraceae bacterium]
MNAWTNQHKKSGTGYFILTLVWLFALAFAPTQGWSQTKKDLEEKRKKIIRDIETTQRMINKTAKNREAAYDRYIALQSQIQSREALIQTLEAEITAAEDGISRNQVVIGSLSSDIANMREEYGKTVRNAFRRKTLSNPILYILSANNLNQAFRRWLFLRKYDERRREQAEAIRLTQEMLAKKNQGLQETRIEKENLLASIQGQKTTLSEELTEKDVMLKELGKDESRLKSDLEKKREAHEALNNAIETIIQEEVRKRVEEARSKPKPVAEAPPKPAPKPAEKVTDSKPAKGPDPSPPPVPAPAPAVENVVAAADNLTLNFQKNKGRLPWPVESGFVSRGYGKQKHPTLKNIEITNNGVDIRTEEGAAVRSVADGKVAGVQFVPGHDYTVILQHGDYYTVYTNLASTSLSKGQDVKAKQQIGQVSTNNITGTSELHFEVWQQKERMNPALWIKK